LRHNISPTDQLSKRTSADCPYSISWGLYFLKVTHKTIDHNGTEQ